MATWFLTSNLDEDKKRYARWVGPIDMPSGHENEQKDGYADGKYVITSFHSKFVKEGDIVYLYCGGETIEVNTERGVYAIGKVYATVSRGLDEVKKSHIIKIETSLIIQDQYENQKDFFCKLVKGRANMKPNHGLLKLDKIKDKEIIEKLEEIVAKYAVK